MKENIMPEDAQKPLNLWAWRPELQQIMSVKYALIANEHYSIRWKSF